MISPLPINRKITVFYSVESLAAIDSFMLHICKHSTAMRRKAWNFWIFPSVYIKKR